MRTFDITDLTEMRLRKADRKQQSDELRREALKSTQDDVQAYLARGGEIQQIPDGVMAETYQSMGQRMKMGKWVINPERELKN